MGKLKGIKEAFNNSVTRENGFTQQFIDDVNWLIEQAEEVKVLESQLENAVFTDTYGDPEPKRIIPIETISVKVSYRGKSPVAPERD